MSGVPEWIVHMVVAGALAEDVGAGDVTTEATVAADARCRAEIVAKAEGVIAGLDLARATFAALDRGAEFEALIADGERASPPAVVARVVGRTRAILTGERTALNFLQRLSGTATLTAQYVQAVDGTGARICDTRKTTPGLRALEKHAVRMGGGTNHRMGLFDGVLVKDNHIRAAGGISDAVRSARQAAHHLVKIEVEVQTLEGAREAVEAGADVIMLDNMTVDEVRGAVELIARRSQVEVSGGVTLETVRALAECGVDLISVGALTHSAPALDLSLEITDVQV